MQKDDHRLQRGAHRCFVMTLDCVAMGEWLTCQMSVTITEKWRWPPVLGSTSVSSVSFDSHKVYNCARFSLQDRRMRNRPAQTGIDHCRTSRFIPVADYVCAQDCRQCLRHWDKKRFRQVFSWLPVSSNSAHRMEGHETHASSRSCRLSWLRLQQRCSSNKQVRADCHATICLSVRCHETHVHELCHCIEKTMASHCVMK